MGADSLSWARSDPAAVWAVQQMGLKALDSINDVRAIKEYLDKNETPWDRQLREAKEANDMLLGKIDTLQTDHRDEISKLQADNRATIEGIVSEFGATNENLTNSFTSTVSGLRDDLRTQRESFDDAYGTLSDSFDALNLQYTALQEEAAEQKRIAANVARASVPAPVESAELPTTGDARDDTTRKGKNNELSSLTVLSGLDTQSNSQSGLQLA